jgi:hypothetical protein
MKMYGENKSSERHSSSHHHIIKLEMIPCSDGVLHPLAELQEFFSVVLVFFMKQAAEFAFSCTVPYQQNNIFVSACRN